RRIVFYCVREAGGEVSFNITWNQGKKSYIIEFLQRPKHKYRVKCLLNCDNLVGSDQTLILTLVPTGSTSGHWGYNKSLAREVKKISRDFIVLQYTAQNRPKKDSIVFRQGRKAVGHNIDIVQAPKGRSCYISPSSGKSVFTKFTVRCINYSFKGVKWVRFHLYRKDSMIGKNEQFYNLIAYGATPEMSDITLSSHKGNPNEAVQLKVKILSIYDSHTEVDLSVLVIVDDQNTTVQKVRKNITDGHLNMNRQENVRFISDVASVIFPSGTASVTDKMQVRNELLKNLGSYKGRTAEWVMLTAHVLEKATGQEDEMKPHGV
ncbi:hypothetical protein RRG08_008518, partial [Elysia crispata]